ncbi:MAG: hypothetical protein COA71_03510 [SAR86 cluster bacterium]|uniref:histidine kinase n=1 Tax=SAR86 cluster bacterium TaxID=2030880 RepID=A0A2A5CFP2_9GAMM|nr:hypothetical protein [Gammaproteobacteria bacterium AH-315-E17]PCJ42592.1 MAG: hypothetical protein COA71_03510 [SAR86 cluster bacterium]
MLTPRAVSIDDERRQQNNQIFNIYGLYRLLLSLILLVSYLFTSDLNFLGSIDPDLYFKTSIFYISFNALIIFRGFLPKLEKIENLQYLAVTIIDIILLITISYACGGVATGMAHLIIVPISAGSMLFQNRMGTFLAAVGTLTAFYSEFYLNFTLDRVEDFYVQVGLLGLTLFAISLILQYLGGKIQKNEMLALRQAEDLQSLEEMNYQIIQRMHTGIIVVNSNGDLLNSNNSAIKLLTQDGKEEQLLELPEKLANELRLWQADNNYISDPVTFNDSSPEVQASFSYLQPEKKSSVLIFLENYSKLSSRAQQLKLISLGRLTASIAHEIRNPLGAISHAGQLLEESPAITPADKRLLEIIETHSKRVNSIINNILGLSRNQDMAPELISLNDWLENFVDKFTASYIDKVHIELKLDEEAILIRFNSSQLEQVLTNLCENGIRYSLEETSQAKIYIRSTLHSNTQIPTLEIIDNGPGIKADDVENIFEPFFTTESSGTGLGLFICKEICEAYQAQISYHRIDDKTCFRIRFSHPEQSIL